MTLVDQDHIGWKSWKLIARTLSNTFALRSPKAIHLLPGECGEILGEIRGRVGKSGVQEHKSGNRLSLKRVKIAEVTMDSL